VPKRIYREAHQQHHAVARTSDPDSGSDSDADVAGASFSES